MDKITRVAFRPGETSAKIAGLWMYDYGQQLEIHGLSLPREVAVEYSLNGQEPTVDRIGYTVDGVTIVAIPDSVLSESGDLKVYIRVLTEESGQTEYTIRGSVKYREKPAIQPESGEENIFGEAIRLTSEAADRAEDAEKSAEGWAHGHVDYPERDEDNARYYAGKAEENEKSAYDSMMDTQRLASQARSDADIANKNAKLAEQYKTQAAQSEANALLSEQASKVSETAAQEAQAGAETAEGQAETHARQASTDKAAVELIKSEADKTAQKIAEDKNIVQGLVDDFAVTHQQAVADVNNAGQMQTERVENTGETAVDNIETSRQQAVESVSYEGTTQKEALKTEGTTQIENVQAVVDGIAQESTAQQILEKSNQSIPFLEEIARNSGKAGSLNGFGLEKGANDSVVITYTNPETEQFESATVFPTDTTLLKIDKAIAGINESLKIIALQKGVEA